MQNNTICLNTDPVLCFLPSKEPKDIVFNVKTNINWLERIKFDLEYIHLSEPQFDDVVYFRDDKYPPFPT